MGGGESGAGASRFAGGGGSGVDVGARRVDVDALGVRLTLVRSQVPRKGVCVVSWPRSVDWAWNATRGTIAVVPSLSPVARRTGAEVWSFFHGPGEQKWPRPLARRSGSQHQPCLGGRSTIACHSRHQVT
jgi:hypothetical protein